MCSYDIIEIARRRFKIKKSGSCWYDPDAKGLFALLLDRAT